jgi:hypothetical protein
MTVLVSLNQELTGNRIRVWDAVVSGDAHSDRECAVPARSATSTVVRMSDSMRLNAATGDVVGGRNCEDGSR